MLHVKRDRRSKLQWDKVQDTGKRSSFGTGSQRDTQEGKGRYDLIPSTVLKRLAQHYENGALKYGDNNWQKGQPLHQYYNSAMRHLNAIKDADISEDHFAAAIWNVAAMIHHIDAMLENTLPIELDSFGIVKAVKDVETFEQIREYYNAEDLKVEAHTITAASNHPSRRMTLDRQNRTRWIPVLVSGAISDGGILDTMISDNADRAKDITTAKLERIQGMTDEEWESYKRQANEVHWKLDPEELG